MEIQFDASIKIYEDGKIEIVKLLDNNNISSIDLKKINKNIQINYLANKLIKKCKKDLIENEENFNILKNIEIQKIKQEEFNKFHSSLSLEKYKNEEHVKKIEELNIIVNNLQNNNTITGKGILGELFVEEYIYKHIKLNEEWSVNNISKDGNHNSDLELIYKNLHCVIEVKNIKAKLSESNIKKFRDTYINSDEKEYNSGIFISLLSEFGPSSNVYDFCIQPNKGKYMIYISKVKENPDKILFAMEILNQIIQLSNNTSEEKQKEILEMLNKQVKNYTNLYSEVNKAIQSVKNMKTNIKDYQEEIIEFLQKKSII